MAEQATKEPTMEEILSSIRRIISEDGSPVDEASAGDLAAAEDDDFLGLGSDLIETDNEPVSVVEGEHLLSVDELLGAESDFSDFESLSEIEALDEAPQSNAAVSSSALDEVFDADELDRSVAEIEASVFPEDSPASAPETHAEAEAAIAEVAAAASPVTPAPATPPLEKVNPVTQASPKNIAPTALTGSATIGGNTVEGMVAGLMEPVVKEWIDANLPAIVERRVESEINQIAAKVIAALRDT